MTNHQTGHSPKRGVRFALVSVPHSRFWFGILLLVALAVRFSPHAQAADTSPVVTKQNRVLFIGIDGCRFDSIQAAKAPQLKAFMEEGIYADNTQILSDRYRKNDTVSGPGWSSILTGVWADKHGVHDNDFKGSNYKDFPHFFHRLKQHRPETRAVSIATWEPIHTRIVSAADVSLSFAKKDKNYAAWDTEAKDAAIKELMENNPDVLFLYQGQVDEAGHATGFHPANRQYIEAIETVDKNLGEVIAALRQRKAFATENWLIVVTSDHGGSGKGHGGGHRNPEILNSFLIVSGAAARRGKFPEATFIVDAPATVLAHLGVPLDPTWAFDGNPRGLK